MGQSIKNENGSVAHAMPPTVTGQVKEVATQVTSEAKELVTTSLGKRREQSAMELTSLANVLREKGEAMEHSLLSPIVAKTADQMDRASEFLKDASVKDVVQSTESFARREPLLFLGGAITLGLIAARFLRSSAHHEVAAPAAPRT